MKHTSKILKKLFNTYQTHTDGDAAAAADDDDDEMLIIQTNMYTFSLISGLYVALNHSEFLLLELSR